MKKNLFMALVAFATLAFVGCEPPVDPTPSGDAKVVLQQHELELTVGTEDKLKATLSPAKEGLKISFKSENEEIATVTSAGIVTGVAEGQVNIIASAEGYKADTCIVTVVDASATFAWGGIGLFGDMGEAVGEEYQHWDEEDQCYYKTKNFIGTFYLWSSEILFTSGVGFSGYGYLTSIKAPVAIIQEGTWKGYFYMPSLVFSDTISATAEGACAPGSLTNAEEWGRYLFDSTYVGDGSFTGTPLHYIDWDNDEEIDFMGFIKDGWITGSTSVTYYQMNITWFNYNEGLYGLKMEQGADEKWHFVQPYEFTSRAEQYYEQLPSSNAKHKCKPLILNNEQVRKLKNISTTKLHVATK